MSIHVIMHVVNETPFEADMEKAPDPAAPFVTVTNPLTRERRPTEWATKGAQIYFFSWARISFIEVLSDSSQDPIVTPYPPRQQAQ
ncbi:MAG TPA: hypothetical protein VMV29_09170 [Ktedonobacterales bacterium]|nr:hypothetical protein [Ktedonobacterales bacterium]